VSDNDSKKKKAVTPHRALIAPLLWDMDEMYGATKGPRMLSGAVGTIDLDDFIQEFDMWCDLQTLQNATWFTPFIAWKCLF
jgi:hypothetical protein